MDTRKFSLRGHKAPVTCITTYQNGLVSADRDGWVVWWNLETKRPHGLWRAHTAVVISLKSTPLGLLTHGKDSYIRFWKPEGTKLVADVSKIGTEVAIPEVFEVPVNLLNFCNVDFCNGLLATPATRDSNNFDVYRISEQFSLQRIVENQAPKTSDFSESGFSDPSDSDPLRREGHGIVMRILFVESVLFVGYESGAVLGFRLKNECVSSGTANNRLLLNKDTKVTVVFEDTGHHPQPVLSLEYDSGKLYTGSASKKLMVFEIGHLIHQEADVVTSSEVYNLKHAGIQSIGIDSSIPSVVAGFWDGVIKGFDVDFNTVFKLERQVEQIRPEQDQEIGQSTKKSLCLHWWYPEKLRKLKEKLLFVGYGDGLVSAYGI